MGKINWKRDGLDLLLFLSVVVVIVLVPLLVFKNYAYSISHSNTFFLLICLLCGLPLLCCKVLCKKRIFYLSISFIDIGFFAFLAYIVIERWLEINAEFSLRYYELLTLTLLYVLVRVVNPSYYSYVLISIFMSGIIQSAHGFLQFLGVLDSDNSLFLITGSFISSGPYGGFQAITAVTSFGLFMHRKEVLSGLVLFGKVGLIVSASMKCLFLFGALSSSLMTVLSDSRASLLALVIGFITVVFIDDIRKSIRTVSSQYNLLKLTLLFGIGAAVLSWLYFLKIDSANGRILIWKVTLSMIRDHFFFGVGYDNFKSKYMLYQSLYFENGKAISRESFLAGDVQYAFNDMIQSIAENGIIIFLMISFIGLMIIKQSLKGSSMSKMCTAILIAYTIFSFFGYAHAVLPLKVIFIVVLGLIANEMPYLLTYKFRKKVGQKVLVFLVLIGVLFSVYSMFLVVKMHSWFNAWGQAKDLMHIRDYKGALSVFDKIDMSKYNNGLLLWEYGQTMYLAGNYEEAAVLISRALSYIDNSAIRTTLGKSLLNLHNVKGAIDEFKVSFNMMPSKFYPLYLLNSCYDQIGENELACFYAREVVTKKVKIPSITIDDFKREMKEYIVSCNCPVTN